MTQWQGHPGKLNFAISGIGARRSSRAIEFAQRTGVNWTYIPYKGGSDAVTAWWRPGHVLFNGMLATCRRSQAAGCGPEISSAQRVPRQGHATVAEQGLPGLRPARSGRCPTPLDARGKRAKLNAELIKVLNRGHERAFAKQGTEVRTGTPESPVPGADEQAKWRQVVKESGTKFD